MKKGFSLVELSIVLVILGLLTGGILTGQSLIRASELRAVSTEFQQYQAAANTFRDKYFAMPGDMRNATDFWGEQAAGTACKTASSTTQATCDGDGDGIIIWTSTNSNEPFRAWQHLANAGLVNDSFTGTEGSSGNNSHAIPGENVPQSKLSTAGWYMQSSLTAANANYFTISYDGVSLIFGEQSATGRTINRALVPEELWNIDTKIDDGKPGQGQVIGLWINDCTSATGPTDTNAEYALQETAINCAVIFRNAL